MQTFIDQVRDAIMVILRDRQMDLDVGDVLITIGASYENDQAEHYLKIVLKPKKAS